MPPRPRPFRIAAAALAAALGLLPASLASERPISFQHEVMAVLSKAGCNSGPCHGNRNGKGGFRLSLRGEDPAADYATLVQGISEIGRAHV